MSEDHYEHKTNFPLGYVRVPVKLSGKTPSDSSQGDFSIRPASMLHRYPTRKAFENTERRQERQDVKLVIDMGSGANLGEGRFSPAYATVMNIIREELGDKVQRLWKSEEPNGVPDLVFADGLKPIASFNEFDIGMHRVPTIYFVDIDSPYANDGFAKFVVFVKRRSDGMYETVGSPSQEVKDYVRTVYDDKN